MARYAVVLPICGTIYVEVEAASEHAAIRAALESDLDIKDVEQWSALEKIVGGNVFYGEQNEAEATLIGEDG